jgi:hypothetical protein
MGPVNKISHVFTLTAGIGEHIACFNNVSEATGQLELNSQRGVKIDRT